MNILKHINKLQRELLVIFFKPSNKQLLAEEYKTILECITIFNEK